MRELTPEELDAAAGGSTYQNMLGTSVGLFTAGVLAVSAAPIVATGLLAGSIIFSAGAIYWGIARNQS